MPLPNESHAQPFSVLKAFFESKADESKHGNQLQPPVKSSSIFLKDCGSTVDRQGEDSASVRQCRGSQAAHERNPGFSLSSPREQLTRGSSATSSGQVKRQSVLSTVIDPSSGHELLIETLSEVSLRTPVRGTDARSSARLERGTNARERLRTSNAIRPGPIKENLSEQGTPTTAGRSTRSPQTPKSVSSSSPRTFQKGNFARPTSSSNARAVLTPPNTVTPIVTRKLASSRANVRPMSIISPSSSPVSRSTTGNPISKIPRRPATATADIVHV